MTRPSASEASSARNWVRNSSLRWSTRSTTTPATGDRISDGTARAMPSRPSARGESVSSKISHTEPSCSMCLPVFDAAKPTQ
jgi:hypothetical protein